MKKVLSYLLFMTGVLVQAQTNFDVVKFEHPGSRAAFVKAGSLNNGSSVGDVLAQFNVPKFRSEIDVVSVNIKATEEGKPVTASSNDENFTAEQKKVLRSADPGSEIFVSVDFKYKDPAKARLECYPAVRKVEYAVTIGPEVEAEFPGGKAEMNQYFRETVVAVVGKEDQESASKANVHFVVNEQGKIT